jgi:hypothetical protein
MTVDRHVPAPLVQMTKSVVGDFPLVHPSRQGRFTRYAWTATTDVKDPKV